jgi:cytoskeletal protein CcmA (bactofilin family)
VSYFSSNRNEREVKAVNGNAVVNGKTELTRPIARNADDVSTVGSGMVITGNIVCAGSLQIQGRVTGDIHASHLAIREGGRVEGKVTALDAVIEGSFTGTINANAVKLQKTAAVDGEIYNKSLAIEENARFEGVSRRLERPIEPPVANPLGGNVTAVLTAAE